MTNDPILTELFDAEMRLRGVNALIDELRAELGDQAEAGVVRKKYNRLAPRHRPKRSAATRKRMAEAQRARWAKVKARGGLRRVS